MDHRLSFFSDELEGAPYGRIVCVNSALIPIWRLERMAIGAVVHSVHRHVARRPIVPTQITVPVRDLGREAGLRQQFSFHGLGLVESPFDVQVVLVVGVVRRGAGLDQHRSDEPVQVQHDHGVPLGEHFRRSPRFGLRLGDEIPVDVEPVGVAARAHDAPIGVLHDIHQEDHVVKNPLHLF